jgi:AcrR family transcriptional regulator
MDCGPAGIQKGFLYKSAGTNSIRERGSNGTRTPLLDCRAATSEDRTVVHFSNHRLKRRAEARRVEILRAAAQIFRSRGFAAAGMREIAVAADLSPGNLYHYFRGKDELLFFCQDRSLDRLIEALRAAAADRRPLVERLHVLAVTHVLCLIADIEGSAAHFEVDALPVTLRRLIVAKRDRYERGVRALVTAGIRSGTLRARDATIATRAFLGALNWTAQWFRPDGRQSAEDVALTVADFALAGLGARPTARAESAASVRQPARPTGRLLGNSHESTRSDRADGQQRADRRRVRLLQNAPRDPA